MALGGGTFLVQNKRLPGAYINTVSVAAASATLSDRGYAALPLEMNWGPQGEIFTVEQGDFLKNSQKLFGYSYTAAALQPMREVFCHAKTVHFFRLDSGGIKASCAFGSAKYPGIRGNALRVVITASESSTEQTPLYDVETFLDTQKVETQEGISTAAELADNDFIVWKDDAVLALTASTPLTGGTNGTVEDLEEAHLTAYAAAAPCSAVTTCTVRIPGVIGPKEVTGRAYAVSAASSTRVQATVALPGVIGPKAVSAPALAGSRLANTRETITIKIGGITI